MNYIFLQSKGKVKSENSKVTGWIFVKEKNINGPKSEGKLEKNRTNAK